MTAKVSLTQLKETTDPSLYRPTCGQSFKDELDYAQTQLDEKRKNFEFLPWASLENLFSNITAGYDYDPSLMSIEQDFNNHHLKQEPQTENPKSEIRNPNSNLLSARPEIQKTIENIIMRSMHLLPNLEHYPALLQASLDGSLLNKLDLRFLIDQIVEQVKLVRSGKKTELSMNLRSSSMEKILLSIVSKNGMIAINIQAPEETRKLLQGQIEELELALKKAHINLSSLKIEGVKNDLQSGANA